MRNEVPLQDRRKFRAEMFTSMIMREIEPYLDRSDEAMEANIHRAVYENLRKLFWQIGVDAVTDFDRASIGLPLRNDQGWTADELHAYERLKLEMMTRPLQHFAFVPNPPAA